MSNALEIRERHSPRLSPTASQIAAAQTPGTQLDAGARSAEGDLFERDAWGNGFLQLESGGTVVFGVQDGTAAKSSADVARAIRHCGMQRVTMPRPVSLGEVLAWAPSRKLGIVFPAAAPSAVLAFPHGVLVAAANRSTVLSAAASERFVLVHGDNYGRVEARRTDGTWETVETVAEYMPAGIDRRYLRRVGEVYGQFQRHRGGAWRSENPAGLRELRLYLIDGRFEMLTDAQHARRHGRPSDGTRGAWPA